MSVYISIFFQLYLDYDISEPWLFDAGYYFVYSSKKIHAGIKEGCKHTTHKIVKHISRLYYLEIWKNLNKNSGRYLI
jgi:hypothetical protein